MMRPRHDIARLNHIARLNATRGRGVRLDLVALYNTVRVYCGIGCHAGGGVILPFWLVKLWRTVPGCRSPFSLRCANGFAY